MSEIILASASPRRRELMENMGLDFSVLVSDADESVVDPGVPPGMYVQQLALLKAAAVAKQVIKNKKALVISADTVVVNEGMILGKPKDADDAFAILKSLSGRTHKVYTGFCVLRVSDAYTVCENVCTKVTFKELSDSKIRRYIASNEVFDKAGAYGIQGLGALLVDKIDGDYFNVVGLPVSKLSRVLEDDFGFELM